MNEPVGILLTAQPNSLPNYSLWNLTLMFFIFSVAGWIWEVIYTAITEKVVAKRGMLRGPWLPLYGVGGILILLLLTRFQSNPLLVFVLAMILCGTVEYLTALAIEKFYGCRWWDYSTKRVHLKGRICLGGVLLFGLSGTAAVCGFGPVLNDNITRISFPVHAGIVTVLSILFIVDVVISIMSPNTGRGITYEINPPETEKLESGKDHEKTKE
ncbi:MAG: putative ABC transporter permease [Clostridia bacterium]|nr:putative ABC transporter permease [Clostridia bacterium]